MYEISVTAFSARGTYFYWRIIMLIAWAVRNPDLISSVTFRLPCHLAADVSSVCSILVCPFDYCSGALIKSKLFINGPWNALDLNNSSCCWNTQNIINDFSLSWTEMCLDVFLRPHPSALGTWSSPILKETKKDFLNFKLFPRCLSPDWSVILLWFSWRGS